MAKYVVFVNMGEYNAYAAGINDDGEYTFTFGIEEAARYDWQADAMNASYNRKLEHSVFLHPSNYSEYPAGMDWEYAAIEK